MKRRKYAVVCWYLTSTEDGLHQYAPKWVSEWPDKVVKWSSRFEISPDKNDAKAFGRDTAIEVAREIRMLNGAWAMVEEL